MPELLERPVLADFQRYVAELEVERGFEGQDVVQKCLMLGEEVGELFKAVRKHAQIKVDLERAFREKEARNKVRVWE